MESELPLRGCLGFERRLPALRALYAQGNPASSATLEAVQAALEARARDSRVLMYVGL